MKPNLDVLKPEIELYLEEMGLAVFYGYSRSLDSVPVVYWDCEQYPDYRLFVQSARARRRQAHGLSSARIFLRARWTRLSNV